MEVSLIWFLMIIVAMMLVFAGVEVNPGPVESEEFKLLVNQMKIMQERIDKRFDEASKQRYQEEWLDLKREVNDIRKDMKGVKKDLKRIDAVERDIRSRNVVIYGMDTNYEENKYDTMYRLMELFSNQMNMRIHEDSIDNCFWLGRRKGRRPLLVKFTRGITREEVLERTRLLKGLRVWIERDFDFSTRKTRSELLPYMWEARKNGKRAILKMDKLKIGNQLFDLEYCKKNFKKEGRKESPIRMSNSQDLQEERGVIQESRGIRRSRSQSPGRRSGSQREQQAADSAQKDNELLTQREESVAGGVQQEVSFRVGGRTRTNDTYVTGNFREEMLQTLSSENGSITRVNRMNRDANSYNLRNWVIKK